MPSVFWTESTDLVPWLHFENTTFPDPSFALDEPEGLVAAGGDLSPQRLISAYRSGIFPWFNEGDPILWWSPDPRCVIAPESVHTSRSMRKFLRKTHWTLSFDTCFDTVIEACAETRSQQEGTWITQQMRDAYQTLHRQGVAHSLEVWDQNRLAGGLYGIAIGPFFFGESMFSREANASKAAFIALGRQLSRWGYRLIDCQLHNHHLTSLGAYEIPRTEFLHYIKQHIDQSVEHLWSPDPDIQSFAWNFDD